MKEFNINRKIGRLSLNQFRLLLAGQERYRTITTAYYRGAMGFILMYDITNEESFKAVADWWVNILKIRDHCQIARLVWSKISDCLTYRFSTISGRVEFN